MARVRLRVGERVSPWETALRHGVLVGPDGVEHAVLVRRLSPPAEAGALRAVARSVLDEGISGLALPLNVSPVDGGGVTVSCPAVAGATLGAVRRWATETGSRVPAGVARAVAQAVEALVVGLEARGLGPDAPVEDGVLWRADGRLLALGPAAAPAPRWDAGDWAMAVGGPAVRYAAPAPGELAAAAGAVFAAMRARTGLGAPPGEEPLELGSVVAPAPPTPAVGPSAVGVAGALAPPPDPTDPSLFEAQAEEAIAVADSAPLAAREAPSVVAAPLVPSGPRQVATPTERPSPPPTVPGVDLGRVAVAVSLVGAVALVAVVFGARWSGRAAPAPAAAVSAVAAPARLPPPAAVTDASAPDAVAPAPALAAPSAPAPGDRPLPAPRAAPPARSIPEANLPTAPPFPEPTPDPRPAAAAGPWTVAFTADAPVDSLSVRCHGGVEATGGGRVVLALPAAGPCRVRATQGGAALEARVSVDGPQEFTCFSQGLSRCR